MKTENVRGRSGIVGKLDALVKDFSLDAAIVWLRDMFSSFETSSAKDIPIGDNKNERSYFASARLVGQVSKLPEKVGGVAVNCPLVVVAAEMLGDMTERTSRAVQFSFAKRVLRDAVGSWSTGLEGIPSQGLFFFYDGRGSFRFSLVSGEVDGRRFKFNEAKRQSFFVRPDAANNIIRRRFASPIKTFAELKDAFSVEQLTKEFYRELFKWYEWAKDSGTSFPNVLNEPKDPKKEKQYNHEAIIRLITRLMFTWFIRQRNLVPSSLFDKAEVKDMLLDFDADSMDADNYYRAILQNLFFATFNTPQSGKDKLTRRWINVKTDAMGNGTGLTSDYHITTVYRYKSEFKDPDGFLEKMRKVPFLNCALFDCLDKVEPKEDGGRRMYFDGFSMRPQRRAHIPNGLFFGDGETGRMGIVTLFSRYEFTIDENEANDGDVALDPELLGKVFENLLGAYNPETEETARKATGSFYTPREIVDYMVEESIKNYLRGKLSLAEDDSRLDDLFDKGKAAEKAPTGFSRDEEKALLEALYACRIIDPACGSGAFPMGILNCMTRLLKRLDDDAGTSIREYLFKRYKEDKAKCDPTETEQDRQERLEELEKRFSEGKLYPDYARKLYLIENCIYGVDIQPIAAQISKLRFFISLLCDQFRTSYNPDGENYGLLSLPNLEAKFVCANTLIALPDAGGDLNLTTGNVGELRDSLVLNRHKIFGARSTKTKEKYKERDKEIRRQIREAVRDGLSKPDEEKIAQLNAMIAQAEARRKEVENPDWQMEETPVQQDFFATTSSQPILIKIDKNADKRSTIDREIDECKRKIDKELAKGGRENVLAATKYADLVAGWDPFDQNATSPFFDSDWMFNIKDGFDVVIGNPPYVSAIEYSKQTSEDEKLRLASMFKTAKGAWDLYILFWERGINILKYRGTIAYITPSKYLSAPYGKALREFIHENASVNIVIDLSHISVFEAASVSTIITVLEKNKQCSNVRVGKPIDVHHISATRFITSDFIDNCPDYIWGAFLSDTAFILSDIKGRTIPLSEVAKVNATSTAAEADDFHAYISNDETKHSIRLINTGTIDPYVSLWGRRELKDQGVKYLTPYLRLDVPVVSSRRRNMYNAPKLIFVKIGRVIEAFFDVDGSYASINTNCVYAPKEGYTLKFLAGICNSRMFMIIYETLFGALRMGAGLQYQAPQLRVMPIPIVSETQQTPIIALVDRILAAKKENPSADTSALEAEIDALVYKLYGLTDEEIKIVEGQCGNGETAQMKPESKAKTKCSSVAQPKRRVRSGGDDDYLE